MYIHTHIGRPPLPYFFPTATLPMSEAAFILKEVTTPEDIIFSNHEPNPEYNGKSLADVAMLLKLARENAYQTDSRFRAMPKQIPIAAAASWPPAWPSPTFKK